jgi:hypothetical protein
MNKFTYTIERDVIYSDRLSGTYWWELRCDGIKVKSGFAHTVRGAKRSLRRASGKYARNRVIEKGEL